MGNKQQTFDRCEKCAGSFPTVTARGLILTLTINTHEDQDEATNDIETPFLHSDNKQLLL